MMYGLVGWYPRGWSHPRLSTCFFRRDERASFRAREGFFSKYMEFVLISYARIGS